MPACAGKAISLDGAVEHNGVRMGQAQALTRGLLTAKLLAAADPKFPVRAQRRTRGLSAAMATAEPFVEAASTTSTSKGVRGV